MRPLFKTLAELRQSLAISLGFGAMAGVIDLQIPILNQFLQQAQSQLWRDVNWRYLYRQHIEDLGLGQRVLDLPDDAPLGNINGIYAYINDEWRELRAGIPRSGEIVSYGYPIWYELTGRQFDVLQVEFEPVPTDKPIPIRIEYYAAPENFTNDDDRCSVPDDILLTLAIIMAKGHYRQPDVQLYADRFSKMLIHAKAENFGVDGEVFRPCRALYDPYAEPVKTK
ncbi:hypothetical protein BWD09_07010 [Neisseria dentiae]|uniref:Uncharacterized protein n=1 Tax=Neisseria dentiae TaxID=194197 RepID=A0A1X3D9C6_9NEIS|nr:hypothetical protein [Neisseria dentiae]OSI16508.1 hypothetical protein BWD09_07010 [Neisseria dentiae]QMT44234.1 hypothetical protein H3L92_06975 [Neisseria dentiae]STZ49907.1 Uncharacterised protein [Neisseria dentiae]STZ83157.1 Uncharacterised protein [Neisseria dentiae]